MGLLESTGIYPILSTGNGESNDPLQGVNLAENMAMGAFTGIAWYNVVELNVAIYLTFKRKRGLYFWALCLSSWGILFHSTAFILKFYGVVGSYIVTCTLITVGWYCMVTGQALVLYSRLHLIVNSRRVLRMVFIMICFNAVTLHIPTTVLTFGSNSPDSDRYTFGYSVMEKIQMTIFCIQEFIISAIYVRATLRMLAPVYRRTIRSVMLQLFWINVLIILLDVAMLVMEYLGYYNIETTLKGMVYSIKLKLEFTVLNQLMRLAQSSRDANVLAEPENKPANSSNRQSIKPGFFGFIQRILPHGDEIYNSSSGNWEGTVQGNNRTVESKVVSMARSKNRDFDDPPTHGITFKTEISQVSSPHNKQLWPERHRVRVEASEIEEEHKYRGSDEVEHVELTEIDASKSLSSPRRPERSLQPQSRLAMTGDAVRFRNDDSAYDHQSRSSSEQQLRDSDLEFGTPSSEDEYITGPSK